MLALLVSLLFQAAPEKETPKKESPPKEILAITGVHVITVAKEPLSQATILIGDGKITEIGKEVSVPEGATVINGKGLTALPGFISPYSRIAAASESSSGSNSPGTLAFDSFDPTDRRLESLAKQGFTTLGIYPSQGTVSGQGLAVKMRWADKAGMVLEKSAYLRIRMSRGTSTKKLLKTVLGKAKNYIEAEKGYIEAKKKYDAERKKREAQKKKSAEEKKPAEGKKAPEKPLVAPKAPKKPDANTLVYVRFLKGELPGIIEISSPADLAHWEQVMKEFSGMAPRRTYVCRSNLFKAIDRVKKEKYRIAMSPELTFLPYTRTRINAPGEVSLAGGKLVMLPSSYSRFLHQMAEMVKFGIPRETALKSFTLHAAEMIGLEKKIGSLEKGKDGDVVLLSGDPFAFSTRVVKVLVDGKVVHTEETP